MTLKFVIFVMQLLRLHSARSGYSRFGDVLQPLEAGAGELGEGGGGGGGGGGVRASQKYF